MQSMLLAVLLVSALFAPAPRTVDRPPVPDDPFSPAVDTRLAGPLRLLADVHDHDGQPIGQQYAGLVTALNLTLVVAELRPGLAGRYTIPTRMVTISEAAMNEDPRFVAAALAHEIKHADDADFVQIGMLDAGCLEIEARGFEAQVLVARAFWPDGVPQRTDFERELASLVDLYQHGGLGALQGWVTQHPGYQQMCARATMHQTGAPAPDELSPPETAPADLIADAV
jgi:hypothetical protein